MTNSSDQNTPQPVMIHGDVLASAIATGQGAIRAILLINGGASIALIAFLGHVFGSCDKEFNSNLVSGLTFSLLLFVVGTALGGITAGVTYLTQMIYSGDFFKKRDKTSKLGIFFHIISIACGVAALGLFCIGGYLTYLAFYAEITV